jgi:hypothetical protein
MLAFSGMSEGFKLRFLLEPDDDAAAFAIVIAPSPFDPLVIGRRQELLTSGCRTSHGGAKVVGHDVILDYPVTVIQQPHAGGAQIVTLWMSPELSCFALRVTTHWKQPDGAWKLVMEKQAVKVSK